jgi:hypothetical protein
MTNPEEIAEKIVFTIFHEPRMDTPGYEALIANAIREALKDQREADAKVADKHAMEFGKPVTPAQLACDVLARRIAMAIRERKIR